MTDHQLAELCTRLHPHGQAADVLAGAALDREHLRRVVEQVGDEPAAWAVEEAATALTSVIETFAHIPDLPLAEIGVSLEALMLHLVAGLTIGPGAGGLALVHFSPMAREAARRDVAFAEIIASMRDVQTRSLTKLLALGRGGASPVEAVVAAVTHSFDSAVTRFVEIYLAEREALLESQVTRRRALVDALLSGEVLDALEVKKQLGVDLGAFHAGLVLGPPAGSSDRDVPRISRLLRSAVPEASLLLLPAAQGRIWAWLTTAVPPGDVIVRRLARAIEGMAGLRAAIGSPAPGAGGFRQTHLQARDLDGWSRRVREASGGELPGSGRGSGLVTWSEHALPAVLSRDPERARWLVQAVLGPLAEDTKTAEEHRLTLQAYLDSGRSLQRAAQLRGVHRNTVVYRLQRIEQLLGRSIGDRELEMQSALLLAADLGVLVLRSSPAVSYPDTSPEADSGSPAQ